MFSSMSDVEQVLSRVPGIRGVLDCEPEIRLDMAAASTTTILAVIFCLVERYPHTTGSLRRELYARGCTASFDKLKSLLLLFEGSNPRKFLWERMPDGVFLPLYLNAPHFSEDWFEGNLEPSAPVGTNTFR